MNVSVAIIVVGVILASFVGFGLWIEHKPTTVVVQISKDAKEEAVKPERIAAKPEWILIDSNNDIIESKTKEIVSWSNKNYGDVDYGEDSQSISYEAHVTRKTYMLETSYPGCTLLVVTTIIGSDNIEVEQDVIHIKNCENLYEHY